MKLENRCHPVSDVDRAKQFYERVGWRLDDDVSPLEGLRIVQFTPPRSGTSVTFGHGSQRPRPARPRPASTVSDIEAAHDDLVGRGIGVSDIWHGPPFPVEARQPGPDPERAATTDRCCYFTDPDGNTCRSSRRSRPDAPVASRRTSNGHRDSGRASARSSRAPRSIREDPRRSQLVDRYAAYMDAREHGSTPDEASDAAGRHIEDVLHDFRICSPASPPYPSAYTDSFCGGAPPSGGSSADRPNTRRDPAGTVGFQRCASAASPPTAEYRAGTLGVATKTARGLAEAIASKYIIKMIVNQEFSSGIEPGPLVDWFPIFPRRRRPVDPCHRGG